LFGEALLAIGKKKTTNQKGGKAEAKGRDADDDGNKKTTSRAMKVRPSNFFTLTVGERASSMVILFSLLKST